MELRQYFRLTLLLALILLVFNAASGSAATAESTTNLFHKFTNLVSNLKPNDFDLVKAAKDKAEDDLAEARGDGDGDGNGAQQKVPSQLMVRLKSKELTFINFHSSSCSHCISHAPIWVDFAKALKVSGADVAALDCDEFRDICSHLKVVGTPSIKVFLKGELVKENLGETLEDLLSVATKDFRLPLVIQGKRASEAEAKLRAASNSKGPVQQAPSRIEESKKATLQGASTIVTAIVSATKPASTFQQEAHSAKNEMSKKNHQAEDKSRETLKEPKLPSTLLETKRKPVADDATVVGSPKLTVKRYNIQPKLKILNDAALSIRYGLEKGVFMGRFVLSDDELKALLKWLDLLRRAFPTASGRWQLEWLYKQVIEASAKAPLASKVFDEILLGWGLARRFHQDYEWKYCAPSSPKVEAGSGYTCGLWLLFHTLSVNIALSPALRDIDISGAIHGFVTHFFSCTECRENFLKHNPVPFSEKSGDTFAFALWLWKEHNHVTNRLNHEEAKAGLMIRGPRELFPPQEMCNTCHREVVSSGTLQGAPDFDEGVVVRYLEHAYSGFPEVEELAFGKEPERTISPSQLMPSIMSTRIFWASFLIVCGAATWMLRKKVKKRFKRSTH